MSKQSLVFDTKLFKKMQSTVNRRLVGTSFSIQLPTIREYCAENAQFLADKDYNFIIEKLIQIAKSGEGSNASSQLAIVNDDSTQENSLLYSSTIKDEWIDAEKPGLVPVQPTQSSDLAVKQEMSATQLSNQVSDTVSLDFSTQAISQDIVEHEVQDIVTCAEDLRGKLAALREFESAVVGDVLEEHKQERLQKRQSVKSALEVNQGVKTISKGIYSENFTQRLNQLRKQVTQ